MSTMGNETAIDNEYAVFAVCMNPASPRVQAKCDFIRYFGSAWSFVMIFLFCLYLLRRARRARLAATRIRANSGYKTEKVAYALAKHKSDLAKEYGMLLNAMNGLGRTVIYYFGCGYLYGSPPIIRHLSTVRIICPSIQFVCLSVHLSTIKRIDILDGSVSHIEENLVLILKSTHQTCAYTQTYSYSHVNINVQIHTSTYTLTWDVPI
jgi:hypothetical protein